MLCERITGIYIASVGNYNDEHIYKFGKSSNFNARHSAHIKTYNHFIVHEIKETSNMDVVETKFKQVLDKMKLRRKLMIDNKERIELFAVKDEDHFYYIMEVLDGIIESNQSRQLIEMSNKYDAEKAYHSTTKMQLEHIKELNNQRDHYEKIIKDMQLKVDIEVLKTKSQEKETAKLQLENNVLKDKMKFLDNELKLKNKAHNEMINYMINVGKGINERTKYDWKKEVEIKRKENDPEMKAKIEMLKKGLDVNDYIKVSDNKNHHNLLKTIYTTTEISRKLPQNGSDKGFTDFKTLLYGLKYNKLKEQCANFLKDLCKLYNIEYNFIKLCTIYDIDMMSEPLLFSLDSELDDE